MPPSWRICRWIHWLRWSVAEDGRDVGVVDDHVRHGLAQQRPQRLDAPVEAWRDQRAVRDGIDGFRKHGLGEVGARALVPAGREEVERRPGERRADEALVGIVIVERISIPLIRAPPQRGEPGQRLAILRMIHQVVNLQHAHGQQPRQEGVDVGAADVVAAHPQRRAARRRRRVRPHGERAVARVVRESLADVGKLLAVERDAQALRRSVEACARAQRCFLQLPLAVVVLRGRDAARADDVRGGVGGLGGGGPGGAGG